MSTVNVKNSATGDMGTKAARRTRYDRADVAFGQIPAAAYEVGDTLVFNLPMKNLIHARFVATADNNDTTTTLELFTGTDISGAIAWDIVNDNDSGVIDYVITYERGTGKVNDGNATAGEGKLIKLTIASSSN